MSPSEDIEWRWVVGHETWYEVSCRGDIRSHVNPRGGHLAYPRRLSAASVTGNNRYRAVVLRRPFRKLRPVHQLVAEAFIGPRPEGLLVLHRDGNKHNNVLGNLYYGTHQDNADDSRRHGTAQVGVKHARARLTEAQVMEIRSVPKYRGVRIDLAKKYGVSVDAIGGIRSGWTWRHLPGGKASVLMDAGLKVSVDTTHGPHPITGEHLPIIRGEAYPNVQ